MQYVFFIDNDKLICQKFRTVYTGNVNTYECLFQIRSDIDGLTWFCVFKQGDKAYQKEIVNNSCMIPHEVLTNEGVLSIGCYAVNFNESDYKRISTGWVNINPKSGAYSEATAPETPSPDVWETLVLKAVPIIGENGNWYTYDITKNEYVDTGKSASGSGGGSPVDAYTKGETDTMFNEKADKPVIVTSSNMEPHPNGLEGLFKITLDKTYDEIISLIEAGKSLYVLFNADGDDLRLDFNYITESGNVLFGMCFGNSYINITVYSSGGSDLKFDYFYTVSAIDMKIGNIETALDSIIAIQNTLIGGGTT